MSRDTTKLFEERVESEWDEGCYSDGGDGYWMTLKHGWTIDDVSCIHEDTRKECLSRLPECRFKTQYWRREFE